MAVYEMVIRFHAGDDSDALEFAVETEKIVSGKFSPPAVWPRRECVIEQLARVVVTNMPGGSGADQR